MRGAGRHAVARWHREALSTPIWEGPATIQALDFLETVQRQRAHEAFLEEMTGYLHAADTEDARVADQTLTTAFHALTGATPKPPNGSPKTPCRGQPTLLRSPCYSVFRNARAKVTRSGPRSMPTGFCAIRNTRCGHWTMPLSGHRQPKTERARG